MHILDGLLHPDAAMQNMLRCIALASVYRPGGKPHPARWQQVAVPVPPLPPADPPADAGTQLHDPQALHRTQQLQHLQRCAQSGSAARCRHARAPMAPEAWAIAGPQ